jgi:hypothetical protein
MWRVGDRLQIAEIEKERSESQERLLNDQKKWIYQQENQF